jgi:dTDP-4-dehydrorhamnose reductase
MKILLFGSTGMIGTAVETVCRNAGIDYIGLNHNDIEVTDDASINKMIEKYAPDVVINSVAIIGINPCENNPVEAFKINSIVASTMAKVCNNSDIIFAQPSSHAVFDGTKNGYYTEDDVPRPINTYSMSKYVAELYAVNLCRKHYVVRFPTMFGSRRNNRTGFCDKVLEKINKGQELRVADDKIDSMTYTIDAAERLISMLKQKMPYGVYHIANAGMISYYSFVKKLIELLEVDAKLVAAKDSDFPALGYKPLKTAMKSVKLPPMRSWEQALSEFVSNYLR